MVGLERGDFNKTAEHRGHLDSDDTHYMAMLASLYTS